MWICVPSALGMSETAACPLSPIADAPSALPSHTSSSSSSQFTPSFPPVHSMPAQVCQCCTAVLHLSRYYTVRLEMFTLTALLFLWLFSFYCFHSYSSATTFLISTFEYRRFCFLQNKVSNFKSVYSLKKERKKKKPEKKKNICFSKRRDRNKLWEIESKQT